MIESLFRSIDSFTSITGRIGSMQRFVSFVKYYNGVCTLDILYISTFYVLLNLLIFHKYVKSAVNSL